MDHLRADVALTLPWLENVICIRQKEGFQTAGTLSFVHCTVRSGARSGAELQLGERR